MCYGPTAVRQYNGRTVVSQAVCLRARQGRRTKRAWGGDTAVARPWMQGRQGRQSLGLTASHAQDGPFEVYLSASHVSVVQKDLFLERSGLRKSAKSAARSGCLGVIVVCRVVSEGIVLDYDSEGNLVGIDIDNASRKLDLAEINLTSLPVHRLRSSA